jgi:glycosyltransferase involved in cell wall biosynthesis
MRIAMLSWESLHSVAVGGVATHVTELAAALARRGHEVHVITRQGPGQESHTWVDGVHYHRCGYRGHHDFVDDVNNMCRAFVDRLWQVEDYVGHFDVIHAHDWLAANAMIWAKQGRGHPCIQTIHATEYARCGNTFPGGRSQRIRDQERAGTYWADRVIAVSQATKNELMWMYEVPEWKVRVVYNGVSPHRFDIAVDPGQVKRGYDIGPLDPTVLFCGRLTHQKGPDLLLETVPFILKYYRNAKFVFAGDGEMRGGLEARARHLGVAHAVRFLGFRNGEELPRMFKMADVLCVPSRNEPFGIVVLEAWSAYKPVVVTHIGGPSEYVRHEETGLKIYPHVDSVSWGLGTLMGNFEWARWMGENGRRTVDEQFTWDKIAEHTLTVYDPDGRLCSAPPRLSLSFPKGIPPSQFEQREPDTVPAGTELSGTLREQADPALRMVVTLLIEPEKLGVSPSDSRRMCERGLAGSGLTPKFRGNTVNVEGDWDLVLTAMKRCHRLLRRQRKVGAHGPADVAHTIAVG